MGKFTIAAPTFRGQLAGIVPLEEEGDVSDFRDVPDSDKGNDGYSDRGMLGSYAPSNREPFDVPEGVKHFSGYGASQEDIARGFCDPSIRQDPAYDKTNYVGRSSEPNVFENDWEFQLRNRQSRGFLTRPRIPSER